MCCTWLKKLTKFNVPNQDLNNGQFAKMGMSDFLQWIDTLPRANPHIVGVQLSDSLLELNRSQLAKLNRFEAMEHLLLIVLDTVDSLVTQYSNSSLPLNPKAQSVSELARGLLRQTVAAFKIIVNELLDASEKGSRMSKMLQFSLQRAMLVSGRLLLESYRVYAPEPKGIWRDLHALYLCSEQHRISTQPFEPLKDRSDSALSIKQAYLRNILLSLSNPYHLMHGEAQGLYERAGRWLSFVRLQPVEEAGGLEGRFVVNLQSDEPPRYVPTGTDIAAPESGLVLNLDELVGVLQGQMDQASAHQQSRGTPITLSERMQRDMYHRIIAALGMRAERRETRLPTSENVSLVEGLTACHYYLNQCKPFTPEAAEDQWLEKIGVKVAKKPTQDVTQSWSLTDMDESVASFDTPSSASRTSTFKAFDKELDDIWVKANKVAVKEKETTSSAMNSSKYDPVTIRKNDHSAGGMAVHCPDNARMKSRVGELVGFAEKRMPSADDWGVGAIRWLRVNEEGGTDIGIMKLAESSLAMATKALQGVGRGSEYVRALLTPRANPMIEPCTLVVPASIYDIGTLLVLNMDELVLYCELTEVLETTSTFTQYQFKLVQPPVALINAEAAVSRVKDSLQG